MFQYKDHLGNTRLSYSGKEQLLHNDTFESSANAFGTKGNATAVNQNGALVVTATGAWAGVEKRIISDAKVGDRLHFTLDVDPGISQGIRIFVTELIHGSSISQQYEIAHADGKQLVFEWVVKQYPALILSVDKNQGYSNTNQTTTFSLQNLRVTKVSNDIIEEDNYYPFGLKHSGYNSLSSSLGNSLAKKIKYNGKEMQDELGLNVYDFGARNYDPTLGRWMNMDPMAEASRRYSPYTYAYNNPIRYIDPDGRMAIDIMPPGDYYDKNGKYLGNDGIDDNKVYQLTGKYQADFENKNVNWGGTLSEKHYTELQGKSSVGTVENMFVTGDAASDKRIQSLHPAIRMQATNFINEANESSDGTLIRVAQGFRTYAEQDALYAQGRTAPGNIVTKAKGGFSNHNFGLAFDIVGITNGKLDYNLDWKSLSTLGKSKGFEWGGDWKFKDMPHFENMFGNGLKELRALPKDKKGLPILKP